MANIVLTSHFVTPRYISQANSNITAAIALLIASEEPNIIEKCFGRYSAKWIYDNIPMDDENELLNTFYYGGYFADSEGNNIRVSGVRTILVDLLYHYISQKIQVLTTSVGNTVNGESRSDFDNNIYQICEAWNHASDCLVGMYKFVSANSEYFENTGVEIQDIGYINEFMI